MTERSVGANVIGGRVELCRIERQYSCVLNVSKFPKRRHWNVTRRDFFRRSPGGLAGNFEMFECTFPRFHGVRGENRIPMQLIDWKTTVIDCRQYLGDANTIYSCLRAEIKAWQLHRDAAFYAATECERRKIGNIDAVFVQAIMACAAQAALVKNVVGQSDFRAGVISGSRQFAARVGAFTAQVHFPCRRHRRSQRLAKIRQIHPSSITIFPLR